MVSDMKNQWTLAWDKPGKKIGALGGQHRTLAHYLLGITKLQPDKWIIIDP
jgi:hypothetical protein